MPHYLPTYLPIYLPTYLRYLKRWQFVLAGSSYGYQPPCVDKNKNGVCDVEEPKRVDKNKNGICDNNEKDDDEGEEQVDELNL